MKRKWFSIVLAIVMLVSVLGVWFTPSTAVADGYETYAQETVQGSAILHCFDWSYNTIKANLADIAKAGYTAVQTSPVQQPKDYSAELTDNAGQWWKLYQPLGFRIAPTVNNAATSWLGTKDELTSLCSEAENYGIKVIVDIVANHLGNITDGGYTLSDGTPNLSQQVEDHLKKAEYFHSETQGIDYNNYTDRYNITHRHMNMPDLNTGHPYIQNQVLSLLNECIDCGVDGFRFDAAKHIEVPGDPEGTRSDFWPTVINGAKSHAAEKGVTLFIYGEALDSLGTALENYTQFMALTDNGTGNAARQNTVSGNAGGLANYVYYKGTSARDSVLWAESHDNYLNDHTNEISNENIVKTWAIVGARADSTSLFFARPSQVMGTANADDTTWKSTEVKEINKFKNYFNGTSEYLSSENNVAYIERGTTGMVISKLNGTGSVELTVHRMKDGTYTDHVSGNTFTVANGKITGTVGGFGVAVIYNSDQTPIDYISATTLYLKPNSNWTQNGNERFAMYLYNNVGDTTWVDLTACDEDGYYSANVPEGDWTNVIFCRMNPNNTDNRWNYDGEGDNKPMWNQTDDLFPDSGTNCYTVMENTWDKGGGTWSVYGNTAEEPLTVSVKVGVISYLINDLGKDGWQVHFWNNSGFTGDADMKATGATETRALGSGYWENAEQTFTMYTAEIPAEATGFKVHNGDNRWFGDDGVLANNDVAYVFNYSGDKADYDTWNTEFCSYRLLLADEIGIQIKVKFARGLNTNEAQMHFTYSDGRDAATQTIANAIKDGNYYWFTAYINALELADTVTAELQNGNEQTLVREYTAIKNITDLEGLYDENTPTGKLVRALHNYGYYLKQTSWTDGLNHKSIDKLEDVTALDASVLEDYRIAKNNVANIGKTDNDIKFSLTLNSNTRINVYVTDSGLTLQDGSDADHSGGYYIFKTRTLGPRLLGTPETVTVTNSAGNSATINVSAMSYAYAVLNKAETDSDTLAKKVAMTAYYNYYQAAAAYPEN